jgi:hypothetical protein
MIFMAKQKVRVLTDGEYSGISAKANDVIELDADDVKGYAGHVDASEAAVKYASSLEQNQPKKAEKAKG